jgi:hypothetical protein
LPNDFTEPTQNLVGLWEFKLNVQVGDFSSTDGQGLNVVYDGNITAVSGAALFDGNIDRIDVEGDDAPFDMAQGSIEVEFTQASQVGSSPDTLVSRGEWNDRSSEGYFGLVDLSRFSAAPRARLSHVSFESDRAFPAQC